MYINFILKQIESRGYWRHTVNIQLNRKFYLRFAPQILYICIKCIQNSWASNSSTLNIFLHFNILQTEAIDVDIDEILDMDTDDIRRSYLFVSICEIQ